jgi:pimeloyl-ACP methyl ester carboxylesterase
VIGRLLWLWQTLVALILGIGVLLAAIAPPSSSAPLSLHRCHVDGLAEEVLCGTFEVVEDRDAATGRRIQLRLTVLPALGRNGHPDPLVILAGGPGQGGRAYAPLVPRYFQRVRRTRDIVLLDLRGTGDSAPLKCSSDEATISLLAGGDDLAIAARKCLSGLEADPRFYTHHYSMADLRDVLRQLGYAKVNLWGGSWGTRSALVFSAAYPEVVRRVVLDGAVAATMDFPWSYPSDAARALDRLFNDCEKDHTCREAFPSAREEVSQWLSDLERRPVVATVRHPRSAAPMKLELDRRVATEVLRATIYSPLEASRIVMAIHHARRGDLGPIVAMADRASSWSVDTMAIGQTLTILCSEDVGRHPVPTTIADTVFGRSAVDFWVESCKVWPKGRPLTISAQTVLENPALILSGDLDPVTPPSRGEAMRKHFPNSLHVIAPGGGHNVSFSGCVPRLIADFIDAPDWRELDASCASAIARPPFVTSMAGGPP